MPGENGVGVLVDLALPGDLEASVLERAIEAADSCEETAESKQGWGPTFVRY